MPDSASAPAPRRPADWDTLVVWLLVGGFGFLVGTDVGSGCVLNSAHRAKVPAWEERDGDWVRGVDPARKVYSLEYRPEARP